MQEDEQFPEFAVGAVAISDKYADWCLTMISSLRHAGEYRGPIYVVTDMPARFSGMTNVVTIEVAHTKARMVAKSCKALLFEWLPQPFVAYIDSDVIVTGSIKAWYERARQKSVRCERPLLTYVASNPVSGSYHSGIVFADRRNALSFLRKWLAMMRSGRYQLDQIALKRVAEPFVPSYFDDEAFLYLYKLHDSDQADAEHPIFVHITNRTIQEYPPQVLRQYLRDSFGVKRMPHHFGS